MLFLASITILIHVIIFLLLALFTFLLLHIVLLFDELL